MSRRQFIDAAARRAIVQQRKREGATWAQIASEIGMTPDALRTWWRFWADTHASIETALAERTERKCLRCRHPFLSEGKHNRMCVDCGQRSESPYAPEPGSSTGRRVARHGTST
jgi:transposase-like protein